MPFCARRRGFAVGTTAVVLGLALASGAAAQGAMDIQHNARRLGGPESFYRPPMTNITQLQRMTARPQIQADLRNVLDQAGLSAIADQVVATLKATGPVVKGVRCADAMPADGTLVQCDFQPGGTLLWMAYRPRGQKGPGLLRGVRWAGAKPFHAYLFRVTTDDRIYTFVLPMDCANLSLAGVEEIPKPPAQLAVDRSCSTDGALRAVVTARGDLSRVARVQVTIDGGFAGELTAPSWSLTSDRPGTYSFSASDRNGNPYPVEPASTRVASCPAPPPPPPPTMVGPTCRVSLSSTRVKGGYAIAVDATGSTTGTSEVGPAIAVELRDATGAVVGSSMTLDSSQTGTFTVRRPGAYQATATVRTPRTVRSGNSVYEGTATCNAGVDVVQPPSTVKFFFDGTFGKERRMRPAASSSAGNPVISVANGSVISAAGSSGSAVELGQCSPLLGLKFGVAKPLSKGWEVAGAVGGAISFVTGDNKVKESELFIDAAVNKYLGGRSFVGTGLSFWDLTRSSTFTPAWLLHFGVPVTPEGAGHPVFVLVEGRLFLDHTSEFSSNYQFWGGVRIQLPKR